MLILIGTILTFVGLVASIVAINGAKSAPSHRVIPRALIGLILNGMVAVPLIHQLMQLAGRGAFQFFGL